jgi:hypothetical protein
VAEHNRKEPNLHKGPDLVPMIILIGIVSTICLGFWLFPYVQKIMQRQDCIAMGRTDCG